MPDTPTGFRRPDFADLLEASRADYAARFAEADLLLRRGILPEFPHIDAAAQHTLHAHLDWIARQAMPLFADDPVWLEAWGRVWDVPRRPAVRAGGAVVLTGVDGATVPAGSLLLRRDGARYAVTAPAVIAAGTATPDVEAETPGAAGNGEAGVRLSLESPLAGVVSGAIVAPGGLVGGADIEGLEAYRTRVLARIRRPPHGGNLDDYATWTRAVPDIRDAIATELADMLYRRVAPGATVRLSWIIEAVSIAAGEDHHRVTHPMADVNHQAGELPTMGTVTYD